MFETEYKPDAEAVASSFSPRTRYWESVRRLIAGGTFLANTGAKDSTWHDADSSSTVNLPPRSRDVRRRRNMFRVWSVTLLKLTTVWLCLLFGRTVFADVLITSGSFGGSIQSGSNGPESSISIQGSSFELTCSRLFTPSFSMIGSFKSVIFYPQAVVNENCMSGGGTVTVTYNGITYNNVGLNLSFTGNAATTPNVSSIPASGSAQGQVTNVVFLMSGTVTTFSAIGTISNIISVSGSGIFNASGVAGYAGDQGTLGGGTYQFMTLPAFVLDTSTEGNWSFNYGGDGFQIANGMSQPAPDASVSMPGTSAYTWASSTSDVRALNNGVDATSRIASAYIGTYGNDFDIDLTLTGGNQRVGLYLLDWDLAGRVEQVTINDTSTNAVIDTQTFSNFQNGQYAVWTLSGDVIIHIKRISGGSSVVSGIFFGPSGSSLSNLAPQPTISNIQTSNITSTSVIISWTTDQQSSSQVNYGLSAAYGGVATNGGPPVTAHSVPVSGLNAGTTYYFDVVSANTAGISATSAGNTFTTAQLTNSPPPNVGYVAFWGINNSGVTISWSTDVPANTQLAYGTTPALGQLTPVQSALTNSHGVVLTGLNSGTTYYFVAQSTGANGATGQSTTYSFTTTGTQTTPAPVISNVLVGNITNTSATITWTTDQASSSQVHYGVTTTYTLSSTLDPTLVTAHSVTLTNLSPGTTYDFDVMSSNSSAVSSTSTNYTFATTGSSPGPVISAVAASNITSGTAVITWTTDQASSSQVNYGTTTAYGQSSTPNPTLVTSHSMMLTGLTPNTTYNFDVVSANSSNVSGTSGNYTFATASSSAPPPVISDVAFWGITTSGVTISWSTNVPANTSVAFGTTNQLGQTSPVQTTLTNSHGVTLTGLNPGIIYYFQAQSADVNGNTGYSTTYSFTTLAGPPTISSVTVTPAANSIATIAWTTSAPTTSYVQYGTAAGIYGRYSALTNLTTTPQCKLSYIPSGTVHYQLVSTDANGNQVTSSDATFVEP